MYGKTPVTAIQEYCAKKGFEKPIYNYIESEDNSKSFICRVEALNEMADGVGRSKREAKHDAAANLRKILKLSHPDIEDISQALHEEIPITDAIVHLRDLCVQQDHPLPSFKIIQQAGPPEAPEFTAECCVATIVRYGTSSTKTAAKQKAAQKIIQIIREIPNYQDEDHQLATLKESSENDNINNQKKILTYRELIDSDIKTIPGTKLSDRHNYFKNLEPDLIKNAIEVLNSEMFSDKNKFSDIMSALKIKYKTQNIPSLQGDDIIFIELICEIDCVFGGNPVQVYTRIIEYFKDMIL